MDKTLKQIFEENKINVERDRLGRFVKCTKNVLKGKELKLIQGEKLYKWKGGCHNTAKSIIKRNNIDTSTCWICKEKVKTLIHHIDGNIHNNKLSNISIVCYFCHHAIHGTGIDTRFKKGHEVPLEIKDKISKKNKGQIPWNKGLIGGIKL